MPSGRVASWAGRVALGVVLAIAMTWPMAVKLDRAARLNFGDGEWSVWNVTWVAHALTTAPTQLFQANIFHPDPDTLAYSEANVVTGALGVPFHLATDGNPYATHNGAILTGLVLSFVFAWGLAAYLGARAPYACLFAVIFTYCPYLFARTAHIQLMMTFGLPLSFWLFHRVVDAPSIGRGAALGAALAAQALACAYYGIFGGLAVGLGTFVYAVSRRLWTSRAYWLSIATGAVVSIGIVAPFFRPYMRVQSELGFSRPIDEAAMFAADWPAWLASSAWAHRWMLPYLEQWNEVLFPGFILSVLGIAGLVVGLRRWSPQATATRVDPAEAPQRSEWSEGGHPDGSESRPYLTLWRRETTVFYGLIALITFWASFGPDAGLYTLLYRTIPVFSFLRAPGRFGILFVLAFGVLTLVALQAFVRSLPRRSQAMVGTALALLVTAEYVTAPIHLQDASTPAPHHRQLRDLPDGALIEMPFWYERLDFPRHARYMLWSTYHWKPMVNGYSDHIPQWFRDQAVPLSSFPTRESFALLEPSGVRYALFHVRWYAGNSRVYLEERLELYQDYLRPINVEGDVWLYEIVGYPQ
jgi:hypothetical protein